jgi:PRTRC genetic system protein E
MKTNFFATIAPFLGSMNLTLTVAKGSGDTVVVSLLPQPRIKDNAKDSVQPMVIRGTIEELDEEFFNAIKEPMTKVTGIVIEIDNFEKGAERLAEENKHQAELKTQAKKNKEKVANMIIKANEFITAKDFKNAEKELDKAIKLTPGTHAVNQLAKNIEDAKPAKNQVDLFVEAEKADAVTAPVIADESGKQIGFDNTTVDNENDLPESPNQLEIENNRIVHSNPMSEAEIEVLQDELDDKANFQVESVNKFNYES